MSVEDGSGRAVLPKARKTRALLAVLALASPKSVSRLQLISLLWSRREPDQARASLRQAIHELQDILGGGEGRFLTVDRHQITLKPDGVWIDLRAAALGTTADPDVLARFQVALLSDMDGLDPAFDRWLDEERRRVILVARAIGEGALLEQPAGPGRLKIAEQLLAIDRTDEAAWRSLIRAHAGTGDRDSAMAAYDSCRVALAQSGQAAPSAETEELADRIRGPNIPEIPSHGTVRSLERQFAGRGRSGLRIGIARPRTIGSTAEDELVSGLTEDITAALSRFRWISCIPVPSFAAGPGDPTPGGTAWSELDLDLLLDGTVQRGVGQIRVIARLLDIRAGGSIIWADRFDREEADNLTLQDDISGAIVARVDPELLMHEGDRAGSTPSDDLTVQDMILRAVPAIYRLDQHEFHAAGELLEAAVALDGGNSVAHAWYAYWHLFLVGQGWADNPALATARAAELAERAVTLDPGDARAVTLAGHVRGFLGKRAEEAAALHDRALALNPNLAMAWCFSGLAQSYLGRHEEAVRRIEHASRLSPSDPHSFFFHMAMIMPRLLRREFEAAADAGRRAVELNPTFSSSYKGYLAALGHLGRDREAAQILTRLLTLEPGFTVATATARSPLARPEDVILYAAGLRAAGLPEGGMPIAT
jgi:DNA-binding SARP family transcriptional activator/TolB-like protein